MSDNYQHIDFEILAGKYLADELSPEEIDMLENIVRENKDKKRRFFEIKKNWNLIESSRHSFNKEEAWKKISSKIDSNSETKIKPIYPSKSFSKRVWHVAAALLILIVSSYFIFNFLHYRQKTIIAKNEIIEHTLQDGSVVNLSYNSSLKYPANFKNERRVSIAGEAFFKVEKDQEKPFIVETQNLEIHVLGTSFYVYSDEGKQFTEVVVYSGEVAIITPDKKKTVLSAGDRAVYSNEEKRIEINEQIDPNILSWKTKVLIFENTKLEEVFKVIENSYNIKIRIRDEDIRDCLITATFKDMAVEDVLTVIQETFNIKYARSDDTILVIGDC